MAGRHTKVTAKMIAKRAGVSQPVVSAVLTGRPDTTVRFSEETRQRVLEAAEQLNYRPSRAARTLLSGRHRSLGVLVGTWRYVTAELVGATCRAAWERGQTITLEPMPRGERITSRTSLPSMLREDVVDGLIVLQRAPEAIRKEMDRIGIPVVWVNTEMRGRPGCITCDEAASMRVGAEHLASRGRRRIGMVDAGPAEHYWERERRPALSRAAEALGLEPPRFLRVHGDIYSGRVLPGVIASVREWLDSNRDLDALVLGVDHLAPQVYRALQGLGLSVPGEVAVLGVGDSPAAALAIPTVTALRVRRAEMAGRAVEMVLGWLETGEAPEPESFVHELVERESTAGT
jgi:DNA-binding LacI/PurR family transcriptional regulator